MEDGVKGEEKRRERSQIRSSIENGKTKEMKVFSKASQLGAEKYCTQSELLFKLSFVGRNYEQLIEIDCHFESNSKERISLSLSSFLPSLGFRCFCETTTTSKTQVQLPRRYVTEPTRQVFLLHFASTSTRRQSTS